MLQNTVVCVLINNGSLGEFYNLLVVDWTCYRLVIVKGAGYGEDYEFEFCGGTCLEVYQGKPRLSVVSDQTN